MASARFLDGSYAGTETGLPPEEILFGSCERAQVLRRKADKVATTNVPVLISGESGTGKELLAKYIHARSPWRDGPFVKVNCAAIPGTLLESELFGYEKAAFTGAYNSKPGRVEMANRGTLFLDEIGELDPSLQAKLLQLLQDGQFSRIGGQEEKRVEIRVISATNRVLENEIQAGNFRQDLFFRINVVHLELPPLRERAADIPLLVRYLCEHFQVKYARHAPPLSSQIMGLLQSYPWRGNFRELENLIKRYVILGSEDVITTELLDGGGGGNINVNMQVDGTLSLKELTRKAARELERKVILKVLEANNWNRRRSARELNISYRALIYKIRQAGLPSKRTGVAQDSDERKHIRGKAEGFAGSAPPAD